MKLKTDTLKTNTRKDIINYIKNNMTNQTELAEEITNNFFDFYLNSLRNKTSIMLKNIGTLAVNHKKARDGGRNPKTGETFKISERYVVTLKKTFKCDKKVTMKEIVQQVSESISEAKYSSVHEAYTLFLSCIYNVAKGEDRIELRGIGVFYPSIIEPRKSRNPLTGETIFTERKIKIGFKCSKKLLEEINS